MCRAQSVRCVDQSTHKSRDSGEDSEYHCFTINRLIHLQLQTQTIRFPQFAVETTSPQHCPSPLTARTAQIGRIPHSRVLRLWKKVIRAANKKVHCTQSPHRRSPPTTDASHGFRRDCMASHCPRRLLLLQTQVSTTTALLLLSHYLPVVPTYLLPPSPTEPQKTKPSAATNTTPPASAPANPAPSQTRAMPRSARTPPPAPSTSS